MREKRNKMIKCESKFLSALIRIFARLNELFLKNTGVKDESRAGAAAILVFG
jgi:hypothetical protein